MAKYSIEEDTLIGIADAIRYQYDSDDDVAVNDMAELIEAIESSGGALFPDNISVVSKVIVSDTSDAVVIPHGQNSKPAYSLVFYSGSRKPYTFLGRFCDCSGYSMITGNGGAVSYRNVISPTSDATNITIPADTTYLKRSGTYYCVLINFAN